VLVDDARQVVERTSEAGTALGVAEVVGGQPLDLGGDLVRQHNAVLTRCR